MMNGTHFLFFQNPLYTFLACFIFPSLFCLHALYLLTPRNFQWVADFDTSTFSSVKYFNFTSETKLKLHTSLCWYFHLVA
jgi:hypothetical protein